MTEFTPYSALAGGALIGLAAVLMMAFNGRISGISGMFHNAVSQADGRAWRLLFLLGLVLGGWLYTALFPGDISAREGFPVSLLVFGGFVVGFGTQLGSGCTSGHGVCGISRLSIRSIVATGVFMLTGFISAFILRHLLGVGA